MKKITYALLSTLLFLNAQAMDVERTPLEIEALEVLTKMRTLIAQQNIQVILNNALQYKKKFGSPRPTKGINKIIEEYALSEQEITSMIFKDGKTLTQTLNSILPKNRYQVYQGKLHSRSTKNYQPVPMKKTK